MIRDTFDFTPFDFKKKGSISLKNPYEILNNSIANYSLDNFFPFRFFSLVYYTQEPFIYFKKILHRVNESSLYSLSFKFNKLFFRIKSSKDIKIQRHSSEKILAVSNYQEKEVKSLLQINILIKLIKYSHFKKTHRSIRLNFTNFIYFYDLPVCGYKYSTMVIKNHNSYSMKYPFLFEITEEGILIWDITSKRVIFELFHPNFCFYEKLIHTKKTINQCYKLAQIKVENFLNKWLTDGKIVKERIKINLRPFIRLKKKFLREYFQDTPLSKKNFHMPFSFIYFERFEFGINIWEKNFQENWDTFDPYFNEMNRSKCKIPNKNYFLNNHKIIFKKKVGIKS